MTTPEERAVALGELTFEVFRVNSSIVRSGDRLVRDLGLTSARWQVLGSIVLADRPQPVAWIAREIGGHRQNVQRIVNDLERDGLVAFAPNPHHKRAQLVVVTAPGAEAYRQALAASAPWALHAADGVSAERLAEAIATLRAVRQNVDTWDHESEEADRA